jgi:large subunit ribosomal protein L5
MSTLKLKYLNEIKAKLKSELGYKNDMQVPKLEKIVINRGLGEAITNSKVIDITAQTMLAITGQKPVLTTAKKSISNFKVRENQVIGCKVVLRGDKMYDFLTKLIFIAFPRIRDFRGISPVAFDGRGNYTLGLKEDNIFPEVSLENSDKLRGFDITFVTTAKSDKESFFLLKELGMPFRAKN